MALGGARRARLARTLTLTLILALTLTLTLTLSLTRRARLARRLLRAIRVGEPLHRFGPPLRRRHAPGVAPE